MGFFRIFAGKSCETACARIIRKNYNGYEKTIFMPHGNDGRADPFATKCI